MNEPFNILKVHLERAIVGSQLIKFPLTSVFRKLVFAIIKLTFVVIKPAFVIIELACQLRDLVIASLQALLKKHDFMKLRELEQARQILYLPADVVRTVLKINPSPERMTFELFILLLLRLERVEQ